MIIKLPIAKHQSKISTIWKPLFAVIVWGFSFIATKDALREISPVVIVFVRQLLGIVFLGLVAKKQKNSFNVNRKDLGWILILAAIASFHLWIQVTGLQWTTASNTGWIIGTTPVFMVILSLIFFKEKISGAQTLGIVISFIGLLFLVSKGDLSSIEFIKNKGDVLIVASAVTWAMYSLVNKKIIFHYSPVMTTFYLFVFVAILISPFAINQENINSIVNLSFRGLFSILFLGILCSGAAYALWAQALSEMSTSKVGAFLYLEPFVTFFGAWLLLGEHVTILTLVSGLIIIGGVVLINKK
jgi:drug/metabolite transporter (DMT)-like permease